MFLPDFSDWSNNDSDLGMPGIILFINEQIKVREQ